MHALAREEEKLEQTIAERRNADLRLFAAEYAGRTLASHEDDRLRHLAIEFVNDMEPLSRRIDKMGANIPEYERLIDLVPRALDEWKDAIIGQRIRQLTAEVGQCSAAGDNEGTLRAMEQIVELKKISARLARNIGDRILTPPRR